MEDVTCGDWGLETQCWGLGRGAYALSEPCEHALQGFRFQG